MTLTAEQWAKLDVPEIERTVQAEIARRLAENVQCVADSPNEPNDLRMILAG